MKRKLIPLILLIVFVAVIAGAYLLYQRLAGDAQPGLVVEPGASTSESSPAPDSAPSAEATPLPENTATPEQTEEPRIEAPDFTVYDADGNPTKLSDFEGKPVILNFWASWCGPCRSEMPEFEQAYAQYGEDIQFVIVNSTDGYQETVDSASEFLAENGYTFPAWYDTDFEASAAYGVTGLPTTFFIDSEGYLEAYASGALNAEILQQGIDMILPAA